MRFKEGVDYRKLSKKERGGKPWKYELTKEYIHSGLDLGDNATSVPGYILYSDRYKMFWIFIDYRWDGSTVVFDTKACMRASLVHDALYQLMREGKLSRNYRMYADQLYRDICKEDGMWGWQAGWRYWGLRLFAGYAAKGKKK